MARFYPWGDVDLKGLKINTKVVWKFRRQTRVKIRQVIGWYNRDYEAELRSKGGA